MLKRYQSPPIYTHQRRRRRRLQQHLLHLIYIYRKKQETTFELGSSHLMKIRVSRQLCVVCAFFVTGGSASSLSHLHKNMDRFSPCCCCYCCCAVEIAYSCVVKFSVGSFQMRLNKNTERREKAWGPEESKAEHNQKKKLTLCYYICDYNCCCCKPIGIKALLVYAYV